MRTWRQTIYQRNAWTLCLLDPLRRFHAVTRFTVRGAKFTHRQERERLVTLQ